MKKEYKYILFDLDGTLTNPELGITTCAMYALEKFGINVPDRTALHPFIGPPLAFSFQNFYGFSQEDTEIAIKHFRERFNDKGIFENELYKDIPFVLETLKNQGKILILATSKPEQFAIRILKHFDIEKYFDFIAGATLDDTRTEKSDVIAHALSIAGITAREKAIMIGDRKYDITGARENNLESLGVTYGFGSREELERAGATYIVTEVKDLLEYI